ncbi:hypothetical protein L596_003790 [Steinernema carpocapsae]|uniref:Uncharacterized protein n=1 Tax=Steinernema carpocapsae TaxID=34508 RepID=A0A4U8UXR8_STECR|nr:hypothetical protein L596_003790 [Steinernema carpocapsae]
MQDCCKTIKLKVVVSWIERRLTNGEGCGEGQEDGERRRARRRPHVLEGQPLLTLMSKQKQRTFAFAITSEAFFVAKSALLNYKKMRKREHIQI